MDKFYEISEDTEEMFLGVFNKKAFPVAVRFLFVGNDKQKQLVTVKKLNDQFEFLLGKELIVSFNENLINVFDDTAKQILIEQELDKISIDPNSGKVKMIKPDLSTFSGIINKYGVEQVARANQITELYDQQQKDGQADLV